jgi:hypothetical protein
MNDKNQKSNQCKTECIDKSKVFCASSDYSQGVCYETGETRTSNSFCSDITSGSPKFFQYLACPNEAACGSKILYPTYNDELIRTVDKYKDDSKMVMDDVCSFIV